MIDAELLKLLTPMQAVGVEKIRIGRNADGGYVMLDDFDGIEACYSIGIDHEVSWDVAMAERGFQVWQYDHTVNRSPILHPNFHFRRLALGIADGPQCETLTTLVALNEHRGPLILKMDIEGGEWDVFAEPKKVFRKFRQIVCEFHRFDRVTSDSHYTAKAIKALQTLTRTHQCVHAHANNYDKLVGYGLGGTMELTFALLSAYQFEPETRPFPTSHDRPNNPAKPDLPLPYLSLLG